MIAHFITLLTAAAYSAIMVAAEPIVKTLTVCGGYNYSYTAVPARDGQITFLLLHGFPSSSYDWRHTISDLTDAGYGVIAPDILGYGETSKPAEVEEYAQEKLSNQVAEILTHENIPHVVGVGHDWYVSSAGSMDLIALT